MAQASSVQREPSMEEILASIRRIIEDSDQKPRADEEETLAQPAQDFADDHGADEAQVETFSAEIGAVSEEEAPAEARDAQILSMAEIQATIREKSAETAAAFAPSTPETGAAEETADEIGFELPATGASTAPASGMPGAGPSASEAEAAPPEAPKPVIISEQAGRQVAAAFGELSEAFAASRRRSFDEMAAEMLRPMLQDWLDNNLPTLVERLVREEIERVARGGER